MIKVKFDSNGYLKEYAPFHSKAREKDQYIHQHVLIAERALGKELPPKAVVHHADETKQNNLSSNLVICEDDNYHKLLHKRLEVVKMGGNPNTQKFCDKCKQLRDLGYFLARSSSLDGLRSECLSCERIRSKAYQQKKRQEKEVLIPSNGSTH